jgi:hypothetical protein
LLIKYTCYRHQARLSNVVEADPDVSAAMDILSFALYHENNKVIGEDDKETSLLGQKRRREEPDLTDSSDVDEEEVLQRQRIDEEGDKSSSATSDKPLVDLKVAIYAEVSRSIEDSISIDDICINVDDRALVIRALQSLEEEGKIMQSEGEIYLVE